MIEERLFIALSPVVDGRVYPQIVPLDNESWPAISFNTISVNSNNTACGESDEDLRVQVDIYSRDPMEVLRLRAAVFVAIKDAIPGSSRITDFDAYEPETKMFRRILEFFI